MTGFQFGIISIFIQRKLFFKINQILGLAALWTIFEWSRLFFLSGFSFNPVGLSLSSSIYSMQFASIGGVFLLSFWVMLTNLFAVRAWISKWNLKNCFLLGITAATPYLFGVVHYHYHDAKFTPEDTLTAILVQPAFPVEETMGFTSAEEARLFVFYEWGHILTLIQKVGKRPIDLIVLPEYVVPYGTYHAIFPHQDVVKMFEEIFGNRRIQHLPPLESPYASYVKTDKGDQWLVSNAFFAKAIANIFKADVLVGLEDSQYVSDKNYENYSAAFHFSPSNSEIYRYEKRVLVPMGEYIPFSFFQKLAAMYGITGSFTAGQSAKVFPGKKVPFSPSICYEETYGNLMRDSKTKGARLLVNITNDGWYPESKLPQQHFDHARLRAVENGIPLARACNTGVTSAVDSLGRIVAILGADDPIRSQTKADSLYVKIPMAHYSTLYSRVGDYLIISLCLLFCIGALVNAKE